MRLKEVQHAWKDCNRIEGKKVQNRKKEGGGKGALFQVKRMGIVASGSQRERPARKKSALETGEGVPKE